MATTEKKAKKKARVKRGKYGPNITGKRANDLILEFQTNFLADNGRLPKVIEIAAALKIDKSAVSKRLKTIKPSLPGNTIGIIRAALPALMYREINYIMSPGNTNPTNPKMFEFLFRACGVEFDPEKLDVSTDIKVKFVNDDFQEPDDVQDSDRDTESL